MPIPLGPDNILGFVSGHPDGQRIPVYRPLDGGGQKPLDRHLGRCQLRRQPGAGDQGLRRGRHFFHRPERSAGISVCRHQRGRTARRHGGLWGKDAMETERLLIEAHGKKQRARVACIGMAGERRSLISGIVNHGGRLAARSGSGCGHGGQTAQGRRAVRCPPGGCA